MLPIVLRIVGAAARLVPAAARAEWLREWDAELRHHSTALRRQRTREFGVRRALGAERGDIVKLVLREGLALTGLGLIAGVMLALPLMRLLRTLLFGATAADPVTFLFAGMALAALAGVACYVPVRRALNVHPADALRFD